MRVLVKVDEGTDVDDLADVVADILGEGLSAEFEAEFDVLVEKWED